MLKYCLLYHFLQGGIPFTMCSFSGDIFFMTMQVTQYTILLRITLLLDHMYYIMYRYCAIRISKKILQPFVQNRFILTILPKTCGVKQTKVNTNSSLACTNRYFRWTFQIYISRSNPSISYLHPGRWMPSVERVADLSADRIPWDGADDHHGYSYRFC